MIDAAPAMLDLTERPHLDQVRADATVLFEAYPNRADLEKLEARLAENKNDVPLAVHLAVKLAKSKRVVAAVADNVHISVVFAVYKEHERIYHRSDAHPHGENFLLRKIEQLQWLFADYANFSWDMTIVDDGCPDGSGEIAQQILAEEYDGDNVQVLFLAEAIAQDLPVTRPMQSTNESRKGGSIAYGMWAAAERERPSQSHIILFTDADLSTHLGQIGLLTDGIVNQGKLSAIGSRREPTSIVVKAGTRNLRGKLFIYLWKRIITNIGYIVDTQCGFKAFTAPTVRAIVGDLIEKGFAFDIELLVKSELLQTEAIINTPIAWIDSEALSTTTDIQPYLTMLKGMVAMYRQYLPSNAESDAFAAFIESLDEPTWQRLVGNIPEGIATREPAEFSAYHGVSVADLQACLAA